jgi:hypothetical protein
MMKEVIMSTKASIKWREQTASHPGFHRYEDVLDEFVCDGDDEPPVFLHLEGVPVQLQTMPAGLASVTIALPRETARALGLLPETHKAASRSQN